MRCISRLLLVWYVALLGPGAVFAQDFKKVFDDKLVVMFNSILDDWDKGSLKFRPKTEFRAEFFTELDRRVKQRPGGYETEAWGENLRKNWGMLPDELKPTHRLTDGAKLVLIGAFADNLGELRDPKSGELRDALKPDKGYVFKVTELPLFIVLGWSQQEAVKREEKSISSNTVEEGLCGFLTRVYPFCRQPRARPR